MLCNYCGETLNSFDEENFGNINVDLMGARRGGCDDFFAVLEVCADKFQIGYG